MPKFSKEEFQKFQSWHHFLESLPNVRLNFGPVKNRDTHPLEQCYLHNIFKLLKEHAKFFDYKYYLLSANSQVEGDYGKGDVVFYLSNEDHKIPENIQNAEFIFTTYYPFELSDRGNIFPIPLGYNGAIPEAQKITSCDIRDIDVFYSGNIYKKRAVFYIGTKIAIVLNRIIGRPLALNINYNRNFTGGLSHLEYARLLMRSKIALVPGGYISKNSFRFYEALRYGCIIITEDLYDHWFYKAFPGIQKKNWLNVYFVINRLVRSAEKMRCLQENTLEYYEEMCSEKAVAKYIREIIFK